MEVIEILNYGRCTNRF